jgi:hypothetical protein
MSIYLFIYLFIKASRKYMLRKGKKSGLMPTSNREKHVTLPNETARLESPRSMTLAMLNLYPRKQKRCERLTR